MLLRLLGVALLVGLVWWFLRRLRLGAGEAQVPSPDSAKKLEIVACGHCGVHLPRQDLLPGRNGALFCSEAHRQAQEARS
jgi:uncharacterized protein